jgi:hypothetical protein
MKDFEQWIITNRAPQFTPTRDQSRDGLMDWFLQNTSMSREDINDFLNTVDANRRDVLSLSVSDGYTGGYVIIFVEII